MQCPACEKEFAPHEYGEPAQCPGCGAFYEKALALKNRRLAAEKTVVADKKPSEGIVEKLSKGWQGAKVSVEEGRQQRDIEQQRTMAALDASAAKPVVVVDIRMSFWSMVVFMVKWVIASVPAAIILALILYAIFLAGTIVVNAVGSYSVYKAMSEAAERKSQLVDESYIDVPAGQSTKYFERGLDQGRYLSVMTVLAREEDKPDLYSVIAVQCRAASAAVSHQVKSLGEAQAIPQPHDLKQIQPGTVRYFIAKRACRGMPEVHPSLL